MSAGRGYGAGEHVLAEMQADAGALSADEFAARWRRWVSLAAESWLYSRRSLDLALPTDLSVGRPQSEVSRARRQHPCHDRGHQLDDPRAALADLGR